jgi:hypothetical protein
MANFLSRFVYLGAVGLALGAAGPSDTSSDEKSNAVMQVQISDVGPLGVQAPQSGTVSATRAQARLPVFQEAPMPDQDVQAPPGSAHQQAQLAPKLLWPSELFQGDGYSYGSSQQTSLENRKSAAAGVGLSVPVSQQ